MNTNTIGERIASAQRNTRFIVNPRRPFAPTHDTAASIAPSLQLINEHVHLMAAQNPDISPITPGNWHTNTPLTTLIIAAIGQANRANRFSRTSAAPTHPLAAGDRVRVIATLEELEPFGYNANDLTQRTATIIRIHEGRTLGATGLCEVELDLDGHGMCFMPRTALALLEPDEPTAANEDELRVGARVIVDATADDLIASGITGTVIAAARRGDVLRGVITAGGLPGDRHWNVHLDDHISTWVYRNDQLILDTQEFDR